MRNLIIYGMLAAGLLSACQNKPRKHTEQETPEVIYHVFQRSFYDSDGDLNGDLNGLREKLDYLQDLGVTSILMVPLYESVYYHNYFSSDFEAIDPSYGTLEDYQALVQDIHQRGMKLYMDMETQYVTQEHLWYKDSYKNPQSPYSDYILYEDSANTQPSTIVADLTELVGYDGVTHKITTVNLRNPEVLQYNIDLFKYWMDPNEDGDFQDGVDGFRLDHMMDHLDNKPQLTDLFAHFWRPLFDSLRALNPDIRLIAEQAEWGSFGIEYLKEADIDNVFAFRLMGVVRNLDKAQIIEAADSLKQLTPEGKGQIHFIENHDIPRFATVVDKHPGKLRVGAALNLLMGGIPSIYYGQEIGMAGGGKLGLFGGITDANEIPEREAFEWFKSDTGQGMALWYKDSGPWWDERNNQPDDGISLQEQQNDPGSLWNYYRDLIALRKENGALGFGDYANLDNPNPEVLSFLRYTEDEACVVVLNLSDQSQQVDVSLGNQGPGAGYRKARRIWGQGDPASFDQNNLQVRLESLGVQVYQLIN